MALGYAALLNTAEQPHWTVFLVDFELARPDVRRIEEQLKDAPSRLLFMSIDGGADSVLERLGAAGVALDRDYVSLQGLVCENASVTELHRLHAAIARSDLARIELPLPECGFRSEFASYLVNIVTNADYDEQEMIADCFFDFLAAAEPYEVVVETPNGSLSVRDDRSWFDLTGRLRTKELRILPAGEVSYTGDNISGDFVVDGAILPFPEHPSAANDAQELLRISADLHRNPVHFQIRDGRVTEVLSEGPAAETFLALFEREPRYRFVTEVGVSFNRECKTFVHDWPAASNETRPGAHIGLGGDPSPDEGFERGKPLVHIDCVAGNCEVVVNGKRFLRARL